MEGQNCRIGKVWTKNDIDILNKVILSINKKIKESENLSKKIFLSIHEETLRWNNEVKSYTC